MYADTSHGVIDARHPEGEVDRAYWGYSECLLIFAFQVLEAIGPQCFRSIASDNTGNTSVAQEKIRASYPWILITPDACHRLHRLCGDLCRIAYFKEVRYNAAIQQLATYANI